MFLSQLPYLHGFSQKAGFLTIHATDILDHMTLLWWANSFMATHFITFLISTYSVQIIAN